MNTDPLKSFRDVLSWLLQLHACANARDRDFFIAKFNEGWTVAAEGKFHLFPWGEKHKQELLEKVLNTHRREAIAQRPSLIESLAITTWRLCTTTSPSTTWPNIEHATMLPLIALCYNWFGLAALRLSFHSLWKKKKQQGGT